jgi:hypothetical protein
MTWNLGGDDYQPLPVKPIEAHPAAFKLYADSGPAARRKEYLRQLDDRLLALGVWAGRHRPPDSIGRPKYRTVQREPEPARTLRRTAQPATQPRDVYFEAAQEEAAKRGMIVRRFNTDIRVR